MSVAPGLPWLYVELLLAAPRLARRMLPWGGDGRAAPAARLLMLRHEGAARGR